MTADGQVSRAHCSPLLGQVPQRGLTVSLDEGGSMLSLIASTDSHAEVKDADGVADGARLPPGGGGGGGGKVAPRLYSFTSVRPLLAPDALVISTRIRCAVTGVNRTLL